MWTMYLPIRAMTGAAVYPVLDDLTDQAAQLDQQYDTVYYLGLGNGRMPLNPSSAWCIPMM